MTSINDMDEKERAADGARFLCTENPMEIVDFTCNHPSCSYRLLDRSLGE